MKISVVIPTHNRSDALQLTLNNLANQKFDQEWEAIVVNNNCTDDTDEVVRHQQFPVNLRLLHETIPGAAAARNKGCSVSQAEYIVFVDNDILVEPDFLKLHLQSLEENPGCWIVGQTRILPEQEATPLGQFRMRLNPIISSSEKLIESTIFIGANSSLPRKDFENLGGFDIGFTIASLEDRDLMIRGREMGAKVLLNPKIIAIHNDWAGSTLRDYCWRQRLYSRSEYYFWQKYGDKNERMRMLIENSPPSWKEDTYKQLLRKYAKKILGSDIGQNSLIGLSNLVERIYSNKLLLWYIYRLSISGAIYKGYQEGIKNYSLK